VCGKFIETRGEGAVLKTLGPALGRGAKAATAAHKVCINKVGTARRRTQRDILIDSKSTVRKKRRRKGRGGGDERIERAFRFFAMNSKQNTKGGINRKKREKDWEPLGSILEDRTDSKKPNRIYTRPAGLTRESLREQKVKRGNRYKKIQERRKSPPRARRKEGCVRLRKGGGGEGKRRGLVVGGGR